MSPKPAEGSDFKALLRASGLRATWPRVAVLQILEASASPMSHAEVHAKLGRKDFDKATIYRNLVDLAEVGLLRRSDHGDHAWRFELKKSGTGEEEKEHPHFVCTDCGTVACLDEVEVKVKNTRKVPKSVASKNVEVKLQGLCDSCA
jgi:Fur family transcriptional regulator, ferric uptake regulator